MEIWIIQMYTGISLLLGAIDLVLAKKCFDKRADAAKYLGLTILGAVSVDLTYLASILTDSYMVASIMTSAYFVSIDWMLIGLLEFIVRFTDKKKDRIQSFFTGAIRLYACAETILFALNPFTEIAVTFAVYARRYARFKFVMKPLYELHLWFTYLMVIYTVVILMQRIIKAPRQYRTQYSFILYGIVCIVAVNALFLFLPEDSLLSLIDYSICFYSVVIGMLYWNCFNYTKHQMLGGLSLTVFENIAQGIVLFDYEGNLVMKNKRAETLLSAVVFTERMPDFLFLRQCGISEKVSNFSKPYSLQCYLNADGRERTLRCDYRPLQDDRGKATGSLYVFTDAELETDLLTGFHKWESFKQFVHESQSQNIRRNSAAAMFDINGLSLINSSSGIEEGDRQIRKLAATMRKYFPTDSYYVRGHDADLIVICNDREDSDMMQMAEKVRQDYEGNCQYSVSSVGRESGDILQTIHEASKSLQVKKLLDQSSQNSQMLSSLVRALKECDSDTEAHVQRTQNMGEKLAKRIGLSDAEQSNLRLLCLLHDIGKIGIPLEILNKPGKLTNEEWAIIRTHVEKGYQIAMSSDKISGIADMILHHHERWDGKGYPTGLSRESIPLLSRVISIVDAFDAMTNNRPYHRAISVNAALEEIRRCAGTQFDPYIASEFIQMIQQQTPAEIEPEEAVKQNSIQYNGQEIPVREPMDSSVVFVVRFSQYLLNEQNQILQIDPVFTEITGYTWEDVQSNQITQLDLIPAEDRTEYIAYVSSQLAKPGPVFLEHKLCRKDGTSLFVFCFAERHYDTVLKAERTKITITDSASSYSARTMANVENEKAQKRQQYWENSYRSDSLTGVLCHAAFRSDVEEKLLAGDCKVVLMNLDLDFFKRYNDTFGHLAGDELLVLLAQTMKSACGENDLACRMGGDEFAIASFMEPETTEKQIEHHVRRIYDKLMITMRALQYPVSISMGCAVSGPERKNFRQMYSAADKALYSSKQHGRDRLTFDWQNSNVY